MKAQRAKILLAATVATLALHAPPAAAQVNDEIVLNIMRECAKIEDPTARLACYDNNIRAGGANPAAIPGQGQTVRGGSAPVTAATGGAAGFGAEDIRTPERFQTPAGQLEELTARVSGSRQRQPGIYIVTLDDGAEWLFTDTVARNYRAPHKGDKVEIKRAALSSFLMYFDGQAAVRVRRIK